MILVDGVWKQSKTVPNVEGEEVTALVTVPIMDVPVRELICKWEDLVNELSDKEAELLKLKEYIQSESFHIETTFDFKEAYGKNNADIRKQHIKVELSDVFDNVQGLELSINWIRSYILLLREVVRCKQNSMPPLNPTPLVLDSAPQMSSKEIEEKIRKAFEEIKQ